MNSLLRFHISANWPAETTACDWALYDARGSLIQRGSSEPRHWPMAESVEAVLSPDQCLSLEVKLPGGAKAARSRSSELIAYAVEERLAGEVENEHFVVGETDADGQTPVWVISRARLRVLLGAFEQLGRKPHRVFSELQLAPFNPGRWSVCLGEQDGFVRVGKESGFAFDFAQQNVHTKPPIALQLALLTARRANRMPESVDVYCVEASAPDAVAWESALGVKVGRAAEYVWQVRPARSVRNFLVGEFTPRGERGAAWAAFRPALVLGALTLVLYSLFSFGEWIWLDRKASSLNAQSMETFRAAFPQVGTIVDPSLQMQRLYDQFKRERGQLGESDFLPMLASVSDAVANSGAYRSMSFEEGRLEFAVSLPNTGAVQRLREALVQRGLDTTLRDSRRTGTSIQATFSVRRSL